jgi:hypothetical protein
VAAGIRRRRWRPEVGNGEGGVRQRGSGLDSLRSVTKTKAAQLLDMAVRRGVDSGRARPL